MTKQPRTWKEIEATDEYQNMPAMERTKLFGEWEGYARQYAQDSGLWNDPQFRSDYGERAKGILNKLGQQPVDAVEAGAYDDAKVPDWVPGSGAINPIRQEVSRLADRINLGVQEFAPQTGAISSELGALATRIPELVTTPIDAVAGTDLTKKYQEANKVGKYFLDQAELARQQQQEIAQAGKALGGGPEMSVGSIPIGTPGDIVQTGASSSLGAVRDLAMSLATGGQSAAPAIQAQAGGLRQLATEAFLNPQVQRSAATAGVSQMMSTLGEARDQYQGSGDNAFDAQVRALPEASLAGLNTYLVTALGGTTGVESVFRQEGAEGLRNKIATVLKDVASEGLEESTDQSVQDLLEKINRNPDKPLADSLSEIFTAGIVGGLVGGGFGGVKEAFTPAEPTVRQQHNDRIISETSQVAETLRQSGAPATAKALEQVAQEKIDRNNIEDEEDAKAAQALEQLRHEDTERYAQRQQPADEASSPVVDQGLPQPAPVQVVGEALPEVAEAPVGEQPGVNPALNEAAQEVQETEKEYPLRVGQENTGTLEQVQPEVTTNAIQIESPGEVPVREPAEGGEGVRQQNEITEEPARAREETEQQAQVAEQRVLLGVSPQPFRVLEKLPQSEVEKRLGEQMYRVQNERTGEEQTVEERDMRIIKARSDLRSKVAKLPRNQQAKAARAIVTNNAPEAYTGAPLTDTPPLAPEHNQAFFDEAAKLGVFDDGSTSQTVLERIASDAKQPQWARILAKRLAAIGSQLPVDVVNRPQSTWAALYTGNRVLLNIAREHVGVAETLLHENAHDLTIRKLQNPDALKGKEREAYNEIARLYEIAARHPSLQVPEGQKPIYGTTSVSEFVAEAFGNPEFRSRLEQIELPKEKQSILQKLRQAIAKLIFRQAAWDGSLLDRVIDNAFVLGGEPVVQDRIAAPNAPANYVLGNAGSWRSVLFNNKANVEARAKAALELTQESSPDLEIPTSEPLNPAQQALLQEPWIMPMLNKLAANFRNTPGTTHEDRVGRGIGAVVRAAQTFSPEGGASFRTYANRIVQNDLINYRRDQIRQSKRSISGSAPIYEDDQYTSLIDQTPAEEDIASQQRELEQVRAKAGDALRAVLANASERDQKILNQYASGMSLRAVAQENGVSPEGVRKILTRYRDAVEKALFLRGIEDINDILERPEAKYGPEQSVASRTRANIEDEEAFNPETVGSLEAQDESRTEPILSEGEANPDEEDIVAANAPRRSQVGGTPGIGHIYEQAKIAPSQEAVRGQVFNGQQEVSEEGTQKAWSLIDRLTNLSSGEAHKTAGEINKVTGNDLGVGLLQNELLSYAVKQAGNGEPKMLNHLLATINLMPTTEFGSGASANAQALRARGEFSSHLITAVKAVIDQADTETARILAGAPAKAEDIQKVKEIKAELERMKVDPDEVLKQVEEIGQKGGVPSVEAMIKRLSSEYPLNESDEIIAIRKLIELARSGAGDFSFSFTNKRPESKITKGLENLINGSLSGYRDKMVKSGANALESAFWSGLSNEERKSGPLAEIDQAQNTQLASIVQQTLKKMGLEGSPENAKLSPIQKVAAILNKKPLSEEKIREADASVQEAINEKMTEAIAAADTDEAKEAARVYYQRIKSAWDQSMSRNLNMPVSDSMMRRLISNEVKEWKFDLLDLALNPPKVDAAKSKIVSAISEKLKASSWDGRSYSEFEGWIGRSLDQMISERLNKYNEALLRKKARESIKATPDELAEGVISGFAKTQSDTPSFPKEKTNAIKEIISEDLKNTPDMGRKSAWQNMLVGRLIGAGVSDNTASKLADVVWKEHQIKAASREMKAQITAAERGPIAPLVESILSSPLHKQQDPAWRKNAIIEYLRNAGLSTNQAEYTSQILEVAINKRMRDAQAKAAEKAIRGYAPWQEREQKQPAKAKSDLDRIIAAVRSRAIDPTTSFADELAQKTGWTGFKPEQFQRLAQLDGVMNDPNSTEQSKAKAANEILDIVARAKLPPKFINTISEAFRGALLSGIKTALINVTSPAFFTLKDLINDSAISAYTTIQGNPNDIPNALENYRQALNSWWGEFAFALKNDTYTKETSELLNNKELKRYFEIGKQEFKSDNLITKGAGLTKMAYSSLDWIRRFLSSLDQASTSVVEQYSIGRYAIDALKRKGLSSQQISDVLRATARAKNQFYSQAIANGMEYTEAMAAANTATKLAWMDAVSARGISGTDIIRSSLNDALSVVGRKGAKGEEDVGFTSYVPLGITRWIGSMHGKNPILDVGTTLLFGFIMIPARVSHYAAWNSPVGLYRLALHKKATEMGNASPYEKSLATDQQIRARTIDAISGSMLLTLLVGAGATGIIKSSMKDDDDRKWGMVLTGNGPSKSSDPLLYDAWNKKWKPWSAYVYVNGQRIAVNLGRGGDAYMWPATIMGSLDDMNIQSKKREGQKVPRNFNEAMYLMGSVFTANAIRSPWSVSMRGWSTPRNNEEAIPQFIGQAANVGKSFIPVFGTAFAKNLSDLFSSPVDKSSVSGAIYANLPVVGPIMGQPALNALGDPIGDMSASGKLWNLGVPIVTPIRNGSDKEKLYGLILEKGQTPSTPNRATVERSLGSPLTDQMWYNYVKTYGDTASQVILDRYDDIKKMTPVQVNKVMDKVSQAAKARAERTIPADLWNERPAQ